eukprot:362207-Pyramimonas_sp.AAC.1
MLSLRRARAQVQEKPLGAASMAVASRHEKEWALGPEAAGWSSRLSKRARAMRREVDRALLTAKGGPKPSWLAKVTE